MTAQPTTIDDVIAASHKRFRLPEWDPRAYAVVIDEWRINVVTPDYPALDAPLGVPRIASPSATLVAVATGLDQAREHTGWEPFADGL